jgi:lipid A 3-O-deacylase
MRKSVRRLAAIVGATVALGAGSARADDPPFIQSSVGIFDIDHNDKATAFNFEYRFADSFLWIFKPIAGGFVTTKRGLYGYGGLRIDIFLGRRLVFTPSTAFGLYDRGNGKDLGDVIEFRSGVELDYRFDNRARLGIGFHHLSNAGIGRINPGTEILGAFFSFPLGGANEP